MRWLLLLCLCLTHAAEAKSPPPFRLTYQDMVAARNNPIGVMNLIEVTGRYLAPDGRVLPLTGPKPALGLPPQSWRYRARRGLLRVVLVCSPGKWVRGMRSLGRASHGPG